MVKLPITVVAVEYAAFQGCFALTTVEMPGCVVFGVRLFSECCALEQIGILEEGTGYRQDQALSGALVPRSHSLAALLVFFCMILDAMCAEVAQVILC